MAEISKQDAYARFLHFGRNSSHFVWFLTDLKFHESSNGCVFGYIRIGDVTIFALEPLCPRPVHSAAMSPEELLGAWREVEAALQPKISLFVSVYEEFFNVLRTAGFQALQVGREPFVRLEDCIPTGKGGKGVRAARNQALRSGVEVEEWKSDRLIAEPATLAEMRAVLYQWKSRNALDLGGFLNSVDPFQHMDMRRYFLARKDCGRLEGFLVATPIPGRNSYFLEDLVLRKNVARGAGELLTLEAMAALAESKAEFASLGVVSMVRVNESSAHGISGFSKTFLVTLPKYLSKIYNVQGLETFRKRFKPHRWESVFIAVRNHPSSGVGDSFAWLKALAALGRSFRPRISISPSYIFEYFAQPFRRYPVSSTVLSISIASFALVNRGGDIPEAVLNRFGYSGSAGFMHLVYLTAVSDFLFFNAAHFVVSIVMMYFVIRWTERCYPRKFVASLVVAGIFLDDWVNQLIIVMPYKYLNHRLFESLVTAIDIGPSLWLSMILGLALCQLKKYREVAFAILSLGVVLGFALSAPRLFVLVLNLNHFLFFTLGFVIGKFRFEFERKVSRQVCRQKPPVAKSVLPANAANGGVGVEKLERRAADAERRRADRRGKIQKG